MRRCTVHHNRLWTVPPAYEGWLLQVEASGTGYPKCVVVDVIGLMRVHDMGVVEVHVPEAIPLLHGAPRRGERTNRAARIAASTEE